MKNKRCKVHAIFSGWMILYCAFLLCTAEVFSQNADAAAIAEGEKIFKANCAACHNVGSKKLIGPGLEGITQKRDREWLYKWIQNSQELIKAGDKDAIAIYEEYNKIPMPPQPLTKEQIDKLLAYIENPSAGNKQQPEASAAADQLKGSDASGKEKEKSYFWLYLVVVIVLFILVAILKSAYYAVLNLKRQKEGESPVEEPSIADAFISLVNKNKAIVTVIVVVAILAITKKGWDVLFEVGVYEGYQPTQPIKFSHKVHAGINKIDCNYCHSAARHSKHAGIPSANVCMNCHRVIQQGTNTGTEEIAKIYKAVGFDPDKGEYIPDYEEKPIKWVKVHNLPDHVFFSHKQHVVAGKIECQTCHGPVQDSFEVAKQWAPLTMKWCIECHRQTKVQDAANPYYEEWHARLPQHLKEMYLKDGKITVDEIGGLECGKCHY